MRLLHLIARQWRQRPARTALSIASVAIAAAAVLGVTLAQASVRIAYRQLLEATEGRPAVEIVEAAGERFDPQRVPPLSDVAGVRSAVPLVTRATMARANGKRFRGVLLGVPATGGEAWEVLPLTEGDVCRQEGEALVSASLAHSLRISVGDRLVVLGSRGPRSARVTGLVNSEALAELAAGATLVMPLTSVQNLYRLGERVNRVRVTLESSASREAAQAQISARLPDDLVAQAPVAQLELAGGILQSTELALRFAGALSMAMAAFIVLNSLRMNFGERRRDMAVLRVLGVTSRQLVGLQLAEGLLLGWIGAVLGIPAGLLLGRLLAALMQRLAEADIPVPDTPYWTLIAALVAGPLVAGLAAVAPALQSRGISPVEALGDVEARRGERVPRWSIVCGAVVWLVAVGLLLLIADERLAAAAAIPAGVLMLVGFVTVIPALLRPVIRPVARLFSPWTRMEGEIAATQLLQRPTRTGLTVGVLVVAISTGIGLGNAIINNVEDVRGWYRRLTAGDVMVAGPSALDGAVDGGGQRDIRQLLASEPTVQDVVETRYMAARASGIPALCIVHDVRPNLELPWALPPAQADRARAALRSGEAVVGYGLARRLELSVGQRVRLEVQGRTFTVRVAEVVRDYSRGGMAVFLDQAAAAKLIDLGPAQFYTVRVAAPLAIDPLVAKLKGVLEEEGFIVEPFTKLRRQLDLLIGGIVGALWGLLAVGFVIGGVAVANTLTMSVFEQTRELGLLRVMGMTRGQLRKLVFAESLLLGVFGTLMGIAAGLTTAWIIHFCNEPLLGYSLPFTLHAGLVLANGLTCLAITLLASWLPGERAARLDFLAAVAYE
jgi:putative ABC transport system permease protein